MITLEKNGWAVSRRLGVGDREAVRSGLLQVYCMSTDQVISQVGAAVAAAKKLGKTARVYINAQKLKIETPALLNHIIMVTMGQARDHDLMEETDLSRKRFDWVLGRCDIIVEPKGGNKNDLRDLIIEHWASTGGREILKGNPARLSELELRSKYPEYYGGEDRLWEEIS
jgi:hypothetical protein